MYYEYTTKLEKIGIAKNGFGEYCVYYNISIDPNFFMAFKTFEIAKEIADKLDEVYYLGGQHWHEIIMY